MAQIEIGPLTDRLSDDEIRDLAAQMEKQGAPPLPHADDSTVASPGEVLDETALRELMDRLDGHDIAAEIYLPIEFDGVVEVASLRVASLNVLIDVLEEVKDELDVEEEEDEDEEDADADADAFDEDQRLLEAQLRAAWKTMNSAAQTALERHLPLHIKS